MELQGQLALVIGGSSGMGLGAARAMAAQGAEVVVTSRSPGRTDAAVEAVTSGLMPGAGARAVGSVRGVACDLVDPDSVRAAVARTGAVDHLVVTAAPGRGGTDRQFVEGKLWGSQVAAEAVATRSPRPGRCYSRPAAWRCVPGPGSGR